MRWHLVSEEGNPKEKGFYLVIKKNRLTSGDFWMSQRKWMGKKWAWNNSIEVFAWIGWHEIRKAGIESLLRRKIKEAR